MAYIYQIINDINDKVYVGKTEASIEKRFREHCADAFTRQKEHRPLYAAMRKYGTSHFHIELIEETDSPNEREIYWIKEKNSYSNGYNATYGGDGTKLINDEEVVEAYKRLGTIKAVAQEMGICVDTIRYSLRNKGVEIDLYPIKKISGNEVFMYTTKGEYVESFSSYGDAARWIISNGKTASDSIEKVSYGIGRAVNQKKRKTAFGHMWYSQKQ